MQIWGETKDCGMDIYYYGMDDFLKSITIESSMHITKAYIKNCYFVLNQKVVARLLHLIFLRKILARKPATFHIQTRCASYRKPVKRTISFRKFVQQIIKMDIQTKKLELLKIRLENENSDYLQRDADRVNQEKTDIRNELSLS